jgi:flagellar biosynthesis protein FliR
VAVVLVEATLGLMGRAAPALPVFFAGMPLRAAAGLGATLLALAVWLDELPGLFRRALELAADLVVGL